VRGAAQLARLEPPRATRAVGGPTRRYAAAPQAGSARAPYPAADAALPRRAHVQAGDREAAALTAARRARPRAWRGLAARRRSTGWRHAARWRSASRGRARPESAAPDDPFGLTRASASVELVARGATNREIGTELFMAEKTASGTSRASCQLDVPSRTAAGLAHPSA